MESWDIYDKERVKTGQTMRRGGPFPQGGCHLVVHVCLFNQAGEMLIQQRQASKEGWPGKWDVTVGGSALTGETSSEAAGRELKEELGIELDLPMMRPHLTVNFPHGYDDIYLVEKPIGLTELTLQAEEVQAAKWASKEEIIAMIRTGDFIPYHISLISLLFEMRSGLGALQDAASD